jgi:uncharacterized protein
MLLKLPDRRRASIALALSVPATSIGAIVALLILPGTLLGQAILVICHLWVIVLPLVWWVGVEGRPIVISPPRRFDWLTGGVIGVLMFGVILGTYGFFLRHWIDVGSLRQKVWSIADITPLSFQMGGVYFTLINALIEEYFWRWFIYSRCREIVSDRLAVVLSAGFFTIHHTISLAIFTDWRTTMVGTLAVFAAGVIWAEYYRRYRSVWSNYLSHAMADLALHIAAWQIFFR